MPLASKNATQNQYRRSETVDVREGAWAERSGGYFRWKVPLDLAIATVLLVPAGVLIAILVLLVRASSKGPGIYKQVRVGKGGRHFTMFKIRSMAVDAEAASGPVWTRPHDRRVTFLGRILRRLHLDELPQIFNVLRGEMSLVGPRPERPEFVRVLSEAIPRYRDRTAVRPGITGLAQIDLPPDNDLASVRRKLVLDLDYIERANLWLDARLLLCTALRIFKVHEGFLTWIFALRRPELQASLDAISEDRSGPVEATPEAILLQAVDHGYMVPAATDNLVSSGGPHHQPEFATRKKPR